MDLLAYIVPFLVVSILLALIIMFIVCGSDIANECNQMIRLLNGESDHEN